ncbi:MAG: 6,7-dimethyl-8-ribityllumazine synthase [Balneolaceae bacterium]
MIQYIEGQADWSKVRIGISAARWNAAITNEMVEGALSALKGRGVLEKNITVVRCPGSYELPLSCKQLLDNLEVDGVIALGVVIRGDTFHFDIVCDAVNRGIMELNLMYNKPVAFGVLTTDTAEQAVQRAGMDKGDKGAEAALALCEMIALGRKMKNIGN